MVDAVHVLSRSVMSDSFVTPWIAAHQAPLSLGFLRQGHWSALPVPSSGDLPNAGIEPKFSCITGGFYTAEPSGNFMQCTQCTQKVWGRKKKNLPKFNFQITLPPDPRRASGPISDCPFLSAKEAGDAPCSRTGKPGGATENVESRAPPGDMGLDSS